MTSFFWSPKYKAPDEDELLAEVLLTKVGDDFCPGDSVAASNWPGMGPGKGGINNAFSPKYCDVSGLGDVRQSFPVLWVRGDEDQVISEAVAGIAATTTYAGLKVTAILDAADYPGAVKISDERMRYLEERILDRGAVRGEWNYSVLPVPRPAPEPDPQPGPRPAGRCPQDVLNHPALTGMEPADLQALAAALQVPFGARREHDNYARRGRGRINAPKNPDAAHGNRRIDVTGHVLALRLREHLRLTADITGALLGVDRTTIGHANSLTRQLLASTGIPLPPAAPPPGIRLRTTDDLCEYAAAAGPTWPSKPSCRCGTRSRPDMA